MGVDKRIDLIIDSFYKKLNENKYTRVYIQKKEVEDFIYFLMGNEEERDH